MSEIAEKPLLAVSCDSEARAAFPSAVAVASGSFGTTPAGTNENDRESPAQITPSFTRLYEAAGKAINEARERGRQKYVQFPRSLILLSNPQIKFCCVGDDWWYSLTASLEESDCTGLSEDYLDEWATGGDIVLITR
jgi:hypothetical protein